MPGYDTNRFTQLPAAEFVCLICYDVLCQPVIVPECEHVFCSDCLIGWLSRCSTIAQTDENSNSESMKVTKYSGHCPIDRTAVHTDELRPPQRVFRNLLSALMIRCRFAPLCDISVAICELEYHECNCPHNPDNVNREIECPKKCGANIRLTAVFEHECVQYLKELLNNSRKKSEEQLKQIVDLIQEKQSLIETIQHDTNKYESTIRKLRSETEKQKKSYENELNKLRSNCNQLVRRVGSGTNSLHLPNTNKQQIVDTSSSSSNSSSTSNCSSNSSSSNNNSTLNNSISKESNTVSGESIVRKSSLNSHMTLISDAFFLETIPSELPPPLTPSKVINTSINSDSNIMISKFYSESIRNLSTYSVESSFNSDSSSLTPNPSSGSSGGVVRNALRMFNKIPTMIPYVSPPAQLNHSTLTLSTLDLNEQIRKLCHNEKIVQVMSLVDRRHFYSSNEYYKCINLKHGAHSFKLAYELKLLELIEPLINGESRILDIGSGHGFLTVCLAQIAKYVLGIEHAKELHSKSREIVQKYYAHLQESNRIEFYRIDGRIRSWNGKFDLILVEAIIKNEIPSALLRSLKTNGIIIAVIKNNSRLQLCQVTIDSSTNRKIIHILNNDHEHLSQQYKDTLCDIRSQETNFLNRFKQL